MANDPDDPIPLEPFKPGTLKRLSRDAIVKMAARTGEAVAENRTGVAPTNPKHLARLRELAGRMRVKQANKES